MHPNHEHLAEEQKGDKVCKPNNPTRPSHGWTCRDKTDAIISGLRADTAARIQLGDMRPPCLPCAQPPVCRPYVARPGGARSDSKRDRPVCVGPGGMKVCVDPKTGKPIVDKWSDYKSMTFVLPPDLDEKIERDRARWEAEEHDLYEHTRAVAPTPAAVWAAERAEAEAEAAAAEAEAAAAEAERARAAAAAAARIRRNGDEARRRVAGKCVKTLIPLITPSLSPTNTPHPPDVSMNPPPGEPNDDSDKSNSSTGTGGLVGTALTAGKNAVLFVITHPVTPYAVGAAVGVGVCYYGYKWFTSGNSESDGKEEEATEEIEKPKT